MMDAVFLRSAITLISFIVFLGIIWWAWGKNRRGRFDEAANLPFADEEMQARTLDQEQRTRGRLQEDGEGG